MVLDKNMGNAINTFVKSLEDEQKSGKLVENSIKKNNENKESSGFEEITNFVKRAVEIICIGEKVNVEADEENLKISVYGNDLGIAIGKDGGNIEALEYVTNLIGRRKKLIDNNVIIDIKDYRKRNIEKIKKVAIEMAKKAIKEGKKIILKPMPSHERKIIHNVLSSLKEVQTRSKNEEPNRRVIIYPVGNS
ncbi:MAG: KH domain-containing protein [Actinobacteria bacterium]|nr:KH domain-containing protein [Actinomycetota bacterium]